MKWSIRQRIGSGYLAAALLIIIIGVVAYRNIGTMRETSQWVTHTREMQQHIVRILSFLQDAETGQRGFVITGQESYLDPYQAGIVEVSSEIASIRALTANPTQHANLERLTPLITAKFAELQESIDLRRNEGFDAALQVVLEGSGKRLMDEIREVLEDMNSVEGTLLTPRQSDAQRSATTTTVVIVGGTLAALAVFFLLAYSITQRISGPVQELVTASGRVAAGDLEVVTIDDSQDEIGALALAYNDMILSLRQARHRIVEHTAELDASRIAAEQQTARAEELAAQAEVAQSAMLDLFRQAEDNGERIRAIVDTVDIGIITIDEQGIVERFNPAAEQIFGYTASEVTGHNIKKLMPQPYRGEHDAYLDRYTTTGEAQIIGIGREVEGRRADGTTFPMDLSVSRTPLGDRLMFTGIVRDITERKRVDRMKNEFISTVSHELRTPLTSVVGSLGLVQGGAVGELPEKAREMIDIALNNSNRLVRLVNDILDIEKIESGKMHFRKEVIEVTPLVEQAIEINHTLGAEQEVSVTLAGTVPGARLQGDNDLLTQVLTNLLSNAVKFSSPGDTVEIAVTRHRDSIRIAVADQGPGIPDTFRPRVFERFAQGDASDSRRQGGTGLGLSICKAIVTRHQGTIDVTSVVGKGSTFFFDIPEWHPEAPATSPASGNDTDPGGGGDGLQGSGEDSRPRVLHVEDDADTTTVLRTAVGNVATIIPALTAASATHALTQYEFDLVVLDRILPDGDGIDLIPLMKKADGSPLPVIIFSVKDVPAKLADTVVAAFVKSRTSVAVVAETIKAIVRGGRAPFGADQHLRYLE